MATPELLPVGVVTVAIVVLAGIATWLLRANTDSGAEPNYPRLLEQSEYDSPTVAISIRQSNALRDRHGQGPSGVVARYLARYLDRAELNYRIERGFDAVTPPEERPRGETPGWWRDRTLDPEATHANLLLVDAAVGGGTYGNRSVVGAGAIDEDLEYRVEGGVNSRIDGNVSAAAHELGWCLKAPVDADRRRPGKQHTGRGWNDDDRKVWVRTPMQIEPGVTNACGEQISGRRYDDVVQRHEFSTCSVDYFEIAASDPEN